MPLFTKVFQLTPEHPDIGKAIRKLTSQQNDLVSAVIAGTSPGMTTADIAQCARDEAARLGVSLSFRSVMGFPDDISVGVRSTVINGVPADLPVRQGDPVRLAVGTQENGKVFSTQNWTYTVGAVSPSTARLLQAVRSAVSEGAAFCRPGVKFSELRAALEAISKREEFFLSSLFAGNQIGSQPFMGPPIVRPTGIFKRDAELVPGVFLSFFALGHAAKPRLSGHDKWALRDTLGHSAACFSHIVEVTEAGPRILSAEHPIALLN